MKENVSAPRVPLHAVARGWSRVFMFMSCGTESRTGTAPFTKYNNTRGSYYTKIITKWKTKHVKYGSDVEALNLPLKSLSHFTGLKSPRLFKLQYSVGLADTCILFRVWSGNCAEMGPSAFLDACLLLLCSWIRQLGRQMEFKLDLTGCIIQVWNWEEGKRPCWMVFVQGWKWGGGATIPPYPFPVTKWYILLYSAAPPHKETWLLRHIIWTYTRLGVLTGSLYALPPLLSVSKPRLFHVYTSMQVTCTSLLFI